jgi:hypothetical protein
VPMPVVIRTRAFDSDFYQAVQPQNRLADDATPDARKRSAHAAAKELFGA